ncbi:MAB_1171c family putative transporter [Streptomyces sp. NPDC001852]|uniref:MAB_1171c family putative transporter n=1 Tax=Streptomyces sp. NPDC001852 TaxID=3364619 RepID=UPI0036C92C44
MNELAKIIGWCSVAVLWLSLAGRATAAIRSRHHRRHWLVVLTATVAITLFQPQVIAWAVNATGSAHVITVARNLVGVLSGGLSLLFIIDSTSGRRLRLVVLVNFTVMLFALVVMDFLHGDYPGPAIPSSGEAATPSPLYWVIVIGAHLVADGLATVICWKYSQRTDDRELAWSLRLYAVGCIFAVVFWGLYLVHLYDRIPGALPYMSVIVNIHGIFRAALLLVPAGSAFVRMAMALRTTWVLWPLWRDLLAAVPNAALAQPQRTRLKEVLKPHVPLTLQAHRQTIETYDALLDLQSYVRPETYEQARRHAERAGTSADGLDAASLAGAIGLARRTKLAGQAPSAPCPLPGVETGSPSLLLAVARHWPSMGDALPMPQQPSAVHP